MIVDIQSKVEFFQKFLKQNSKADFIKIAYVGESSRIDIDISDLKPANAPYFFTSITGQFCIVGTVDGKWEITFKTSNETSIIGNTLRFITAAWYCNVYRFSLKFVD